MTYPTALAIPAAGLARLDDWARLAERAYAANTRRAWRSDWASFTAWCAATGARALPAVPETVAAYLTAQAAAGRKLATLQRRLATIARAHAAAGLESPCRSEPVRMTLKALARTNPQRQKQAPGLTDEHVTRIRGARQARRPDERLRDLRDAALIMVGRDLLARASELVSVTVEAITWEADGTAALLLRRIKTATQAEQLLSADSAEALRAWLIAAGITEGAVFRGIDRGGRVGQRAMCTRAVAKALRAAGRRAALKPRFSAHSLRVGMAQDMAASDITSLMIAQAGAWKSLSMVLRYTERQQLRRGAVAQYHARRNR